MAFEGRAQFADEGPPGDPKNHGILSIVRLTG